MLSRCPWASSCWAALRPVRSGRHRMAKASQKGRDGRSRQLVRVGTILVRTRHGTAAWFRAILENAMSDAGSTGRLHSCLVRWSGLVAGGLGLAATLAAAAPPRLYQGAGPPPHAPVTHLMNSLTAVSADSPSDAWAVGDDPALALHWNGTRWVQTAVPNLGGSALLGVSALSASDAWAVGTHGGGNGKTLILHWNGKTWTQVRSPNVNGNGGLFGVAALSPANAWAVGAYTPGKGTKTLVLHWNGKAWTQVPSPSPGTPPVRDSLEGVTAVSSSDAWAVGARGSKTLVLHWNGKTWAQVPSPSPRGIGIGPFTFLDGVSALSATDAWAVGCACTSDTDITLVLHWNGKTWTRS